MKKVIFLCLLSLSVCLSKPAENLVGPATPPANGIPPPTINSALKNGTDPTKEKELLKTELENATQSVPTNQTAANQNETTVLPTKETPPKDVTPKPTGDNKTQNKEGEKNTAPTPTEGAPAATKETKVVTEKPTTVKPEGEKAKNGTNPDKDVTPKSNDAPKTTEAPKADKDAHVVQSGGFSGTSFFGGIVLTLGVIAIGFMGYKYYKNQTERNYHTL